MRNVAQDPKLGNEAPVNDPVAKLRRDVNEVLDDVNRRYNEVLLAFEMLHGYLLNIIEDEDDDDEDDEDDEDEDEDDDHDEDDDEDDEDDDDQDRSDAAIAWAENMAEQVAAVLEKIKDARPRLRA
jgi:ABC-type Zn2+ transport system substrate-binding protein/surface adhesin